MTRGTGGERRWCTCRTKAWKRSSPLGLIPLTWAAGGWGMAALRTLLVVTGLTIAFACLAAMAVDDLAAASRRVRRRVGRLVRPESVRVALAQAGLTSIPVPAWILSRIGLAVAAAAIAWAVVRPPVLGLIAFLLLHPLIGTALEFRRRVFEARHQEALLEAVRHGIAVMSRPGNATPILESH